MAKKNNERIDLSKSDDELLKDVENGATGVQTVAPSEETGAQPGVAGEGDELVKPVIPVEGVNPPQPEVPASVLEPDLSEEATDKAIEFGPEEPKKKGFAWLWTLIGIAIVLAFLGWTFLKKGDKTDANAPEQTEETVPVADSANDDSVASLPSEGSSDEAVASEAENSTNGAENGAEGGAAMDEGKVSANSSVANAGKDNTVTANASQPSTAEATVPSTSIQGSDVEAEAMKVIRGEYGNNPVRRNNLGSKYQEIQNRVNELKRTGKF
ncbi:MAG: hypothetical protein K2K81_03765 [Muribaculaceae bacterium]|nr:hypothetical protein [Muribaculaceae bacterium]